MRSLRVLVFGSDDVTVGGLKELIKCHRLSGLDVITPMGNHTKSAPIKFCNDNNIKYYSIPKNINYKMDGYMLPDNRYDIGISMSFGYLIPGHIINSFKYGIINVHPSLLPQYRGSAPIPYSILNNDKISGVTIIKINEMFDKGNIISQHLYDINRYYNFKTLRDELSCFGGKMLSNTLNNLDQFLENSIQQNNETHRHNIKSIFNISNSIDISPYISNIDTSQQYWFHNNDIKQLLLNDNPNITDTFKLIKSKKIPKEWININWNLPANEIYYRHAAIFGLLRHSRTQLGTKSNESLSIIIEEFAHPNEYNLNDDKFTSDMNIGSIIYCNKCDLLFVKCGNNSNIGIKKMRIGASQSFASLKTFNKFIDKYGHFIPTMNQKLEM